MFDYLLIAGLIGCILANLELHWQSKREQAQEDSQYLEDQRDMSEVFYE